MRGARHQYDFRRVSRDEQGTYRVTGLPVLLDCTLDGELVAGNDAIG